MSDKSQDTIDQEMAAYKTLGSLDQRDIVATSELSNVIDALRSDLSTKLDCQTGNPIVSGAVKTLSGIQTSGDIEIYGHTIKVLSGNYIQTDDALGYVQNYSARNSFLQAECPQRYYDKYGIACTGSKGYCILSINTSQRYIRLSGDLSELIEFHNLCANVQFSISFGSGSYSQELKITDIAQDNAEWGHIITDVATKIGNQTSATCIDNWENDDNAFYCPKAPHVGNTAIPAFYGSHAEGASTKAIQRCTHAEGRNTLADIRYSHAEGSDTYAAEMYSHAEGNKTKALGRASHSEGNNTTAKGENSHTEGANTEAFGVESHAEGSSTNALGDASHAEGFATYAAKYAHSEGEQTSALGMDSHTEGRLTLANASGAHAEGQSSVASGNYSHAEGNWTQALSEYSHAEGISTVVSGLWSHAEGYQTSAFGNYSHAEGGLTLAGKVKSGSTAATYSTHAEGYQTSAIGIASHASGIKTNVSNDYAFGWNGKSAETYSSHGNGTFNINPVNGLSGFYIGNKNLGQYVGDINSSITSIQNNYALKTEARDMSAYALQQASSYTNTVSSNLSTTFTSTINTVSGETLVSAQFYARETSSNALADAKTYADGISSELCTTVGTRLSDLSVELSGDYCEKIEKAAEAAVISAENACYIVSSLEDAPIEGNNVGDAAIVSAKIAGSNSLISRTSYYWNGNAWAAMDGNYTADNVYFEDDISCVGPWTSVGNISKGSTTAISAIHSKGESLKTVLESIFMRDQDDATVVQPTFTVQLTSTTVGEVGTTTTPKFKVTFNPGSYTYGSLASDGMTWVNGTGVTASILSAVELSGTATLTSLASITSGATYTSPSAVVVTDSAGSSFKVNAFVSYTKGNTVCTAAHKASTLKTPIAAGTKTASASLPAGYRKPFWGYILATETQPSTNTSEWTSSLIRGLRGNTATSTAGLPTSYNIPSNVTWIIFACAAIGGKSNVVVIDDKSKQEQTFTKQPSAVNVEGANGYTAVPYNIFWKRFSSPTEAEMNLKMTWS